MSIEEFMKRDGIVCHLVMGDAWMFWDDLEMNWVVMQRKQYAKNNVVWCVEEEIDLALEALERSQE